MARKQKSEGKNRYYSVINKLRKEKRSSEEFEIILNALSLEEVIALKLELSAKSAFKGKLYGIPLWSSMVAIVHDALLKYALSATKTKKETARFLGINETELHKRLVRFQAEDYFKEELDIEEEMV
jgi:DNA-binding NtrC family response regulator